MTYQLTKEAEEDLIRIYRYGYKMFGETQADKYFASFFDSFDRIATNPFQFPRADHIREGYRYCVSGSDTIYFRINDSTIEIIAIVGHQDFCE